MNRLPGLLGFLQTIAVAIVVAVLICLFSLRDRLEDVWEEF